MTGDNIKITHYVYIWRNYGPPRKGTSQRPGWWQREGVKWITDDDEERIFLHSTPLGGFGGLMRCVAIDAPQPAAPKWLEVAATMDEAIAMIDAQAAAPAQAIDAQKAAAQAQAIANFEAQKAAEAAEAAAAADN